LAASAKNGNPIETANSVSNHHASWPAGGLAQPLAIANGSSAHPAIMTARWVRIETRSGAKRVSARA